MACLYNFAYDTAALWQFCCLFKGNKLFTSKWIEVKQNSTNIITQDIWPYIVL